MTKINTHIHFRTFVTIIIILFASLIRSFSQSKIKFDSLEYTMNTVKRGEQAILKIPFKNIGNKPLFIIKAQGSGVPAVSRPQNLIYPNQTDSIWVKIPTERVGKTRHQIIITSNAIDSITSLVVKLEVIENPKLERVVFGIVKDSIGIIPGATVFVDGTNKGTQTDFNGKYSIRATPEQFLIFSFLGFKEKRIKASETEINVLLEGGIKLEEVSPYHNLRKKNVSTSAQEIISNYTPSQYFKKMKKKGIFFIFVPDLSYLEPKDLEFQKKYNITYSSFNNEYKAYFKEYNLLTFEHLNKKHQKHWLTEIRKDTIGLENFEK